MVLQATQQAFKEWLNNAGVDFSDTIVIKYTNSFGFSMHAAKDLQKNDVVVEIPKSVMMTFTDACNHKVLGGLIEKHEFIKNNQSCAVALLLLFESENKESKWREYIDILPETFESINLPIFYKPDVLDKLNKAMVYSNLSTLEFYMLEEVIKVRDASLELFDKLVPVLTGSLKNFGLDRYKWAMSIMMSRQNNIMIEQPGKQPTPIIALIPLFDLFNHAFIAENAPSSVYSIENFQMEMSTARDVKKGDEIFMVYGKRSNQSLFMYSGFLMDHVSKYDRLSITIPTKTKKKELTCGVGLGECTEVMQSVYLNIMTDKDTVGATVMIGRVRDWLKIRFELICTSHRRQIEKLLVEESEDGNDKASLRLIRRMYETEEKHFKGLINDLIEVVDV